MHVGSKLLAADIRIATRLLFAMLNGRTLSWREQRQLRRTVADIFRLVPFIIIVLIPFMEFALPVLLKVCACTAELCLLSSCSLVCYLRRSRTS